MSTRPTSHRTRQSRRTRDDILDAVIRVLSVGDEQGALIEQIATEAGMSRATLYAHFPGGVDELVGQAYERTGHEFTRRVRERQSGLVSWSERMTVHAAVMVDLADDPYLGRFYNVTSRKFPSVSSVSGEGSRASFDDFVAELTRASDAGSIAGIDVIETAHLLTGCVRDVGVRAALDPDKGKAALGAFATLLQRLETGGVPGVETEAAR